MEMKTMMQSRWAASAIGSIPLLWLLLIAYGTAAQAIIQVGHRMQVTPVEPPPPSQNIDVSLDRIELNDTNMTWYLSALNRNTSATDFQRFWKWDVYVTDEKGTSYNCR